MLPRRNHGQTEYSRLQDHVLYLDQLGVVYYELLKPTEAITGDRYRTQLMRLSRALKDKRPQRETRESDFAA